MTVTNIIRPKERDAILNSLRIGVVPRIGIHHLQVGRTLEVKAMIRDIERLADGGGAFRVVVGRYGSGKSFFISMVQAVSLQYKLVTTKADLAPNRRLHATNGAARALYKDLMVNLATAARPGGGALLNIVESFVASAEEEANAVGRTTESVIQQRLASLKELSGGYAFAQVIEAYWKGHRDDSPSLRSAAVQWLSAEYASLTEAREQLGFRIGHIISDTNFHESLKLFTRFVRLAGYAGLMVCLDEMVNVYKLNNAISRSNNFEQILAMLNDTMQGEGGGLGYLLAGTPEFLEDNRRGLYSYEALRSRLVVVDMGNPAIVDVDGPVIKLSPLTPEELVVLLRAIRHVHAHGDANAYRIPDAGITEFLHLASKQLGSEFFRTPRTTITKFTAILSQLEQNPGITWEQLLQTVVVPKDTGAEADEIGSGTDDDDLKDFKV